MNIIVHYPTSDEAKAELSERVSKIHSDAVTAFISNLSCPHEQKKELIKAVIASHSNN